MRGDAFIDDKTHTMEIEIIAEGEKALENDDLELKEVALNLDLKNQFYRRGCGGFSSKNISTRSFSLRPLGSDLEKAKQMEDVLEVRWLRI